MSACTCPFLWSCWLFDVLSHKFTPQTSKWNALSIAIWSHLPTRWSFWRPFLRTQESRRRQHSFTSENIVIAKTKAYSERHLTLLCLCKTFCGLPKYYLSKDKDFIFLFFDMYFDVFSLEWWTFNEFIHTFLCDSDRWIFLSFPLNFDHLKKAVVNVIIDCSRTYLQEYCSIFDREKHLINVI